MQIVRLHRQQCGAQLIYFLQIATCRLTSELLTEFGWTKLPNPTRLIGVLISPSVNEELKVIFAQFMLIPKTNGIRTALPFFVSILKMDDKNGYAVTIGTKGKRIGVQIKFGAHLIGEQNENAQKHNGVQILRQNFKQKSV